VEEEIQKDEALQKIIEDLKSNPDSRRNYTLENNKLYYKVRLVLSSTSSWIPRMIWKFHTTPIGGHLGIFRTYSKITQSLY